MQRLLGVSIDISRIVEKFATRALEPVCLPKIAWLDHNHNNSTLANRNLRSLFWKIFMPFGIWKTSLLILHSPTLEAFYLYFCPTTTSRSAVMLAPFFISVTIFANRSRHWDFVPSSDVFSRAVNMAYDSSNPINALSVKALRCSWMGGKMVAATSDSRFSRKMVSRLGIQLENMG